MKPAQICIWSKWTAITMYNKKGNLNLCQIQNKTKISHSPIVIAPTTKPCAATRMWIKWTDILVSPLLFIFSSLYPTMARNPAMPADGTTDQTEAVSPLLKVSYCANSLYQFFLTHSKILNYCSRFAFSFHSILFLYLELLLSQYFLLYVRTK